MTDTFFKPVRVDIVDKELISIDPNGCCTISNYSPPENIMETLYVKQHFDVSYKAYHVHDLLISRAGVLLTKKPKKLFMICLYYTRTIWYSSHFEMT